MNILALDFGSKTGYAVHRGGDIACGTQRFIQRNSWHPGRRWSEFRAWVSGMIDEHHVTLIAFEEVRRHKGTHAGHIYGGYRAMTEMVAQQHNVPMVCFGVGVIKKAWTGKGNADKQRMIDEAKSRGFAPIDDNAADALAILHCALKEVV